LLNGRQTLILNLEEWHNLIHQPLIHQPIPIGALTLILGSIEFHDRIGLKN
jgi:hypothetical protein